MTRILVVKTSSMGDVIHAFAAVADARAALPGVTIDWMVEEPFVDLVRLHPAVNEVVPVALRRWRKALLRPSLWAATLAEIRAVRARLRARHYDLAIDAQGLVKSALLARLAGVPIHGYDRHSAREPLTARLEHHGYDIPYNQHAVDRMRVLFGLALGYRPDMGRFRTGLERVAEYRADAGSGGDVLLFHGTTWLTKEWPLDNWVGLAAALADAGLRPVVTAGNDREAATARAILDAVPETHFLTRRPLGELAGDMAGAVAAIGVDTGLTHLAAALGISTYALFSATRPEQAGPKGRQVRVLTSTADCAPCGARRCPLGLTALPLPCHVSMTVERVVAMLRADGVLRA